MKRCLVCVGTSSFDSLIRRIDMVSIEGVEFFVQYGNSHVKPKNHLSVRWLEDFDRVFNEFDLMISHAGAGTVYDALERGFPIIVVPNMERVDLHQLELAKYVERNSYAEVLLNIEDIDVVIKSVIAGKNYYSRYEKDSFFMLNDIIDLVGG